jgi:hypothetical protein
MRDDLKLAAYAVALGYSLHIDGGKRPFKPDSFIAGIPHDGLSFERGAVHVWDTARGWRVAKLEGGRFPRPVPEEFFPSLLKALDAGAARFDPQPDAGKVMFAALEEAELFLANEPARAGDGWLAETLRSVRNAIATGKGA